MVEDPAPFVRRLVKRGEGFRNASDRETLAALQFPRRSITTGNCRISAKGRSPFGDVELMVDTLHLVFPILVTRPLVGGWRARFTEKQTLDWEVAEDYKFEGTWGTNILVHNVGEDGKRTSVETVERLHDDANRQVYRQWVKVMGSPTKHQTGQNAFGTLDMEALCLYYIGLLERHPHVYDVDELEFWRTSRITKLDISGVAHVPEDDLLWLLDYISKHAVVAGKHKDVNGLLRGNSTWYSHMATSGTQVEHQLKLYAKGPDITKPEKKGGVNRDLYFYDLLAHDSRNWLRIERALHTKALGRWYSTSPDWWSAQNLVKAWEDGMATVSWPEFTRGDVHKVIGEGVLSAGAYATFYGWLQGDDPFRQACVGQLYRSGRMVNRATIYRHRKEILAASRGRIDVKNPRPLEQNPEIVRIVRCGTVTRPEYLRGLPLVA